jgi:restriction system protein
MAAKTSIERVGEIMKAVLTELKNAGGEAKLKDLFERSEPKLNLTEYEKAAHEKSGYIRWRSIVHFYSIDCVKAGYLQKSSGRWMLTPEGEKALKKQPPSSLGRLYSTTGRGRRTRQLQREIFRLLPNPRNRQKNTRAADCL